MKITYFYDIVCPWCVIGKRYLLEAITSFKQETGIAVNVEWRSFILDPTIPKSGLPFKETMVTKKGISPEMLEQMFCMVESAGEQAGLCFNFNQVTRMPYVQYAHQLIALTPQEQKSDLIDCLTNAYFQENQDIGDLDTLRALATKSGLDRKLINHLSEGAGWDKVLMDLQAARDLDIQGVPFIVINNKYAVSGARTAAELLKLFKSI